MGYARTVGIERPGANFIRKNFVYEDSKENFRTVYVEFHENGCMTFGEIFDGLYHVMINFKPDDMEFIKKNIIEFDVKEFEIFHTEKEETEDDSQL